MSVSASRGQRLQQLLLGLAILPLPLTVLAAAGIAVTNPPVVRPASDGYSATVLAHACPDEYFYGVGNSANDYEANGIDPTNCPPGSVAKVNQAYVWGMGQSSGDIYFGTLANGDKLVEDLYLNGLNPDTTYAYAEVQEGTASYYGSQHALTHNGLNPGDWRPPQMFRYNLAAHSLTLLDLPLTSFAAQSNLMNIAGIRAGGTATTNRYNSHEMVLLAGPPLDHNAGGVAFFLFDATAKNFIGTTVNHSYNNIRRMISVNGDLYFGVQKTNSLDGAVVRWVNNPNAKGYPFSFAEVGTLDEMGADICLHNGRLFCTTWPGYVEDSFSDLTNLVKTITPAGLYLRAPGLWMSPVVPAGGLTTADNTKWQKIWSVANYEPDQVVAVTLGGGALASFDGYLYFGTMQVPYSGAVALSLFYGSYQSLAGANNLINNTWRPLSLFRVSNFRTPVSVNGTIVRPGGDFELLYGYTNMPVFTPTSGGDIYATNSNWVSTANKMGQTPSMGAAGFDARYRYNTYTWSMGVFDNTLFVGTFCDYLPTAAHFSKYATNSSAATTPYGGQLYCLHSSQASNFRPVSVNGLGNICNYGFRTMTSDSNGLYIGTANPRNLLPNPTNSPAYGGWELLKLARRPSALYDMDCDFEADPAWMTTTGATFVVKSANGSVTNFAGAATSLAAWADYDGDGFTDPAWCNPATGVWTVWFSSRNGQPSTLPAFASSGSVPVPADFDGDGKADPALCTTASGKITWRGTLTGKTYSITPTVSPAGKAFLPAIGDYNGDGVSELVWYVPPTATTTGRIVRCTTTTVAKFTTTSLAGSFKGVPVPADYDGDGKTDFAINDPVTGRIRVWPSSAPGTFIDSPTPGSGWLPMVADYDGDGKADFAWYNPTSGIFRIIYSSTSATDDTDTVAEFGIPTGSRPVAAPAAVWYTK